MTIATRAGAIEGTLDSDEKYTVSKSTTVVSGQTVFENKKTAVASVSGFYVNAVSTGGRAGSSMRMTVHVPNSRSAEMIARANRSIAGAKFKK
jgi:hypothetical protein